MYTIYDNIGNKHTLKAGSDTEALEIMKKTTSTTFTVF